MVSVKEWVIEDINYHKRKYLEKDFIQSKYDIKLIIK
jgi:hypothetical protein